jgi:hypothetical protein
MGAAIASAAASAKQAATPYRMPLMNRTLATMFARGGNSPADFGVSRYCAQLRRKNKLRRLGISGQRI